jgi:SAM-dependent methyltransferase
MARGFDELVALGASEPVEGWDFSWLDGRASEERPPWGYAQLIDAAAAQAEAVLDVQTGGAEVIAGVAAQPRLLAATESWLPNLAIAGARLRRRGGFVVGVADAPTLPFREASFDLVTSRHPVVTNWDEIHRVLRPGGVFLSQQIGDGTMRELSEAMLGPLPAPRDTSLLIRAAATDVGLEVERLESAVLPAVFYDIAGVVYFLRKVIWTVPDFTVGAYLPQLERLHQQIELDGSFIAHSRRVLVVARRR